MSLSFKEVAEIVKIIDASACEELILELDTTRLVIRRGGSVATSTPASPPPVAASTPRPEAPAPNDAARPAAETNSDGTQVRAPMVGTFYRRPAPDEPPFVSVGDDVQQGDTLCLIEVMKLFTSITAPTDGVVTAIPAKDASLVEFDQLLMVVG